MCWKLLARLLLQVVLSNSREFRNFCSRELWRPIPWIPRISREKLFYWNISLSNNLKDTFFIQDSHLQGLVDINHILAPYSIQLCYINQHLFALHDAKIACLDIYLKTASHFLWQRLDFKHFNYKANWELLDFKILTIKP